MPLRRSNPVQRPERSSSSTEFLLRSEKWFSGGIGLQSHPDPQPLEDSGVDIA